MFLNDINHGYRAAVLKKNSLWLLSFFIWLWLLLDIIKKCGERCALQLHRFSLNIMPKLLLSFCRHLQKTRKMSYCRHFNRHDSGSNHDNKTNEHIPIICFLSSIRWYILFLYFKTFKI